MTSRPPPPRQAWFQLAGALGLEIPVIYWEGRSAFQNELKEKKNYWKKFIPLNCKPLAPQAGGAGRLPGQLPGPGMAPRPTACSGLRDLPPTPTLLTRAGAAFAWSAKGGQLLANSFSTPHLQSPFPVPTALLSFSSSRAARNSFPCWSGRAVLG